MDLLSLESSPGSGTTVTILLPAANPGRGAPDTQDRNFPVPKGRGRVLVVDDEAIVLRAVSRLLQSLGYEVTTAVSGKAAIDFFEEEHTQIDLVLLDLSMPRMDGLRCLSRLRQIEPAVCVVICTGNVDSDVTETIFNTGAAGVLLKPFDRTELGELVEKFIADRSVFAARRTSDSERIRSQ